MKVFNIVHNLTLFCIILLFRSHEFSGFFWFVYFTSCSFCKWRQILFDGYVAVFVMNFMERFVGSVVDNQI